MTSLMSRDESLTISELNHSSYNMKKHWDATSVLFCYPAETYSLTALTSHHLPHEDTERKIPVADYI